MKIENLLENFLVELNKLEQSTLSTLEKVDKLLVQISKLRDDIKKFAIRKNNEALKDLIIQTLVLSNTKDFKIKNNVTVIGYSQYNIAPKPVKYWNSLKKEPKEAMLLGKEVHLSNRYDIIKNEAQSFLENSISSLKKHLERVISTL